MFQQLRLSAAAQKARDVGHRFFLIDRRMSETGIAVLQIGFNARQRAGRFAKRLVAFMGERHPTQGFVAARPTRMPPSAQAAGYQS